MLKNYKYLCIFLITGFVLILSGFIFSGLNVKHVNLNTIAPDNIENLDDGSIIYTIKAENQPDSTSIAFLTVHQETVVTKGDRIVYTSDKNNNMWGHTTGVKWNFITTSEGSSDMQIKTISCYPELTNKQPVFYIGYSKDIAFGILYSSVWQYLSSIIIIIIGISLIVFWIIYRKTNPNHYDALNLGLFSLIIGLWTANETLALSLLIPERIGCCYMSFNLLIMMCIPFCLFFKDFLKVPDNWIWKIVCALSVGCLIILNILQFLNIRDMRQNLIFIHLLIIITITHSMGCEFYCISKRVQKRRTIITLISGFGILLAILVDLANFSSSKGDSDILGRFLFLVFIFYLGVESAKTSIIMIKKGYEARTLELLALTDTMTGFYNSNAFIKYSSSMPSGYQKAVVSFDLNELKKCNDTYGHIAGDNYIATAASIIREAYGAYGTCYRVGGDEFLCIIENLHHFNQFEAMNTLRSLEMEQNSKNRLPVELHIACGFSEGDNISDTILSLRELADEKMYDNKMKLKGMS